MVENGHKRFEANIVDGKYMSALVWKPNGEKCDATNYNDANGVIVKYNDDGKAIGRSTYEKRQTSRLATKPARPHNL